MSCREGAIPYPCTCDPPGYHEGTLTITQAAGGLGGELRYRTCMPGAPCGPEQGVPMAAQGQLFTPDSVAFYLTNASFYGGSGSWSHYAAHNGGTIRGRHWRKDGSIRGCGDDVGLFTAVRQ
jgi:hypothetical protein